MAYAACVKAEGGQIEHLIN